MLKGDSSDNSFTKGSKWYGTAKHPKPFDALYCGLCAEEQRLYPDLTTTLMITQKKDRVENRYSRYILVCYTCRKKDHPDGKCEFRVYAKHIDGDDFCTIVEINMKHIEHTNGAQQRKHSVYVKLAGTSSGFLTNLQLTDGVKVAKVTVS
jgi:hypothetical protein